MNSSPVGLHRVLEPPGVLPQAARRLDPDPRIRDDEVRVRLERLNLDAASYRQLHTEHGGDPDRIRAEVLKIIESRGKMQNPVTGSGGMLIGVVDEVGPASPLGLHPDDRVATLVSLTLTPLLLEEIVSVEPKAERLAVRGKAVLFASGLWAPLPADVPLEMALAVLDVCGAPAWVARLAKGGMRILVIGAGKSGSLACAQARKLGAQVTALDYDRAAAERLVKEGLADAAVQADATKPLEVFGKASEFDLVVNCASVPGTEMASILAARDGGEVLFFSMATSFTAAALGAEGVGKDVRLTIGNGYARGHAKLALDLVRESPALRRLFAARVS
jgi:NADPH:quinone reductase-like Zn-dependent oxidoreductase